MLEVCVVLFFEESFKLFITHVAEVIKSRFSADESHCGVDINPLESSKVRRRRVFTYRNGGKDWMVVDHGRKGVTDQRGKRAGI